jgi:hypothetical protein
MRDIIATVKLRVVQGAKKDGHWGERGFGVPKVEPTFKSEDGKTLKTRGMTGVAYCAVMFRID